MNRWAFSPIDINIDMDIWVIKGFGLGSAGGLYLYIFYKIFIL
jgi:hypothetical protein